MVVEFSSLFYGATERPDSGHGFGIGIRQSVAFISIVEAMEPEFFYDRCDLSCDDESVCFISAKKSFVLRP